MTYEQLLTRAVLLGCTIGPDKDLMLGSDRVFYPAEHDKDEYLTALWIDRELNLSMAAKYTGEQVLKIIEQLVQLKEVSS